MYVLRMSYLYKVGVTVIPVLERGLMDISGHKVVGERALNSCDSTIQFCKRYCKAT